MSWEVRQGDALERLREMPDGLAQTCVTSPPYFGLRDYSAPGQVGVERTPEDYVVRLVEVFRQVWRVLREDGTLWLNLGDTYASVGETAKPKDLLGIPWMVAFALRADGWYLRSDIVWSKPNPMPESVTDRPTKAHEYLFLLSKQRNYYYDADSIREDGVSPAQTAHNERYAHEYEAHTQRAQAGDGIQPGNNGNQGIHSRPGPGGRNKRSVWNVATMPFPGAHFAVFPPKLIEPCVLAGSSPRACGACGGPWVRVVETKRVPRPTAGPTRGGGSHSHAELKGYSETGLGAALMAESRTVGWEPTCTCHWAKGFEGYGTHDPDGSGSSVVLDPFSGAGTTGLVALQHGRSFLGIELNPAYVEMARERIATAERLGFRSPQEGPQMIDGQLSLDGEAA